MLTYLQANLGLMLILTAIIGLIIGSFLNVVIFRYPQMLLRMWKAECRELLKQPPTRKPKTFNLARPASHCLKCKKNH